MSLEQIGIVAAAALVAFWPSLKGIVMSAVNRVRPAAPAATAFVGYEQAIHDLAVVRSRLAKTGLLTDESKKAIDVLTLALVAGSDT